MARGTPILAHLRARDTVFLKQPGKQKELELELTMVGKQELVPKLLPAGSSTARSPAARRGRSSSRGTLTSHATS